MLLPAFSVHAASGFSDLPKSNFAYDAIVYFSDRGVLTGYDDGTFKPDAKVKRAEALKLIASNFVPKTETVKLKSTDFSDVPDEAWYLPYIKWAITKKVIQGPPVATTFRPASAVTKAEFLKMLFVANGVDLKSYSDLSFPLSSDEGSPTAWHFPILRYAVATGTTFATDKGLLAPDRQLTRADVALLLYRFTLYKSGMRTQELLTSAKGEVETVITSLSKGKVDAGEAASVRGVLLTRAALAIEPDNATVKVAVKISEGFKALATAYRASLNGNMEAVIKNCKAATALADQAAKISGDAKALADQLRNYAKSFTDQAKKAS